MPTTLKSKLPPLNSLVAFEAAARSGSFVGAARALSVTPAAITRHIDRLEDWLGVRLFQAKGRGRTLTEPGKRLFDGVIMGFEHIAEVAARIRQQEPSAELALSSPLAFASLWLVPRIVSFRKAHPDISMRFVTADADVDPSNEGISLAVRFGDGNWPELRVRPMIRPRVFPVCSPQYLALHGPVRSLEDLARHTLLDRETRGEDPFSIGWVRWLSALGSPPCALPSRISFSSYEVIVHAALASQGIALGVDILVKDMVARNLLMRPLEREVHWREGYHLVSPRNGAITAPMRSFGSWLFKEITTTGTGPTDPQVRAAADT